MKEQLVHALKSKYSADFKMHKANLDIYLNNPVGFGEHPQHLDEVDKLLQVIVDAEEKIKVIDRWVK